MEPWLNRNDLRERFATFLPETPHYNTIQRAIQRGMPAHRSPLNGRIYFLWSEVEAWLKQPETFPVLPKAVQKATRKVA
jgi:hypothetical protein